MEYRLKFYCILPRLELVHRRVPGVYDVVTHPQHRVDWRRPFPRRPLPGGSHAFLMNPIRLLHTVCRSVLGGAIALAIAAAIVAPCRAAVDFAKDVQPILEMNCVSCHAGEKAEGYKRKAFFRAAHSAVIWPETFTESRLPGRTRASDQ